MKKTTLYKEYALDEPRYKRYCSILGVDSSLPEFPASMVGDFEQIVVWFNEQKDLQDGEASARYAEYKATLRSPVVSSSNVSEAVGAALDASRAQIEQEVSAIVGETKEVLEDLRNQYFAGIYAIAGNVFLREAQNLKMQRYPVFATEDPVALPAAQEGDG